MEAIEKVRKKLNELKQKAMNAMAELTREREIREIEAELQTLEREQVKGNEEAMKSRRDEAVAMAVESDGEEKVLLEKLVAVRKKKAEALARFEENIPVRRIQTSSSEFICLQREVEFLQEIGFTSDNSLLTGERTDSRLFEKRKKTEHALIDCVPSKLDRFKAKGWFISPGQDPIKAEILDNENSMEVGMAVPDVFYPRMD
jgi:hypothetical protein